MPDFENRWWRWQNAREREREIFSLSCSYRTKKFVEIERVQFT